MAKKYTQQEMIEKFIAVHGSKFDYSKVIYKNTRTPVIITCRIHGPFEQRILHHLIGQGCAKCAYAEKAYSTQEYIAKARTVHGEGRYDYSKVVYVSALKPVIIICPKHEEFLQVAYAHTVKKHGCPECGRESLSKTTEQFIAESIAVHGEGKYDYAKVVYAGDSGRVIIICQKHGEFLQIAGNHLAGNGCPHCTHKVSKPEVSWLDSLGLPNDPQHRQVKIKIGKKNYNVDGYDPLTNTVYEFHGDYWHGNLNIYEPDYLNKVAGKSMQYLYDKTCKKHRDVKGAGYNLVWIWASDWEKQIAVNKMFAEAA